MEMKTTVEEAKKRAVELMYMIDITRQGVLK